MTLKVILDFVKVELILGDCEAFENQHQLQEAIGKITNWGSRDLDSYSKEEKKQLELLREKNGNIEIYRVQALSNSVFDVLDTLSNKSLALMYVNTGNLWCKKVMLNIIEAKKIKWYCNFSEFWFRPKGIKEPMELKKKIQHFKRLVKEENALIPF